MSERGSFVTEYIYCPKCLEAAHEILCKEEKFLCGRTVVSWEQDAPNDLPIIAGKIGSTYPGGELDTFKEELIPALCPLLCHSLRIAVLAEKGDQILIVNPLGLPSSASLQSPLCQFTSMGEQT